jgi:nickel-type superoxide dismutase maturation protease
MKLLKFFGQPNGHKSPSMVCAQSVGSLLSKPKSLVLTGFLTLPLYVRRIEGGSMTPTLRHGQIIVVRRRQTNVRLRVNDIVVFWHNGCEKVKRVAAIDRAVVYAYGDNLTGSTDSRHFGPIPLTSVTGIVIWPRQNYRPYS